MKEMEVGVRDVNWRLVGAWTTGSATERTLNHIKSSDLLCLCVHCGVTVAIFVQSYGCICHLNFVFKLLYFHIWKMDAFSVAA